MINCVKKLQVKLTVIRKWESRNCTKYKQLISLFCIEQNERLCKLIFASILMQRFQNETIK